LNNPRARRQRGGLPARLRPSDGSPARAHPADWFPGGSYWCRFPRARSRPVPLPLPAPPLHACPRGTAVPAAAVSLPSRYRKF